MTTLALLSTLISSLALVGVVVSLLLQARLLRTTQLQAARTAQLELIRLAIEHPALSRKGMSPTEKYASAQRAFFNWRVKYLELGYSLKVISLHSVMIQAGQMFKVAD